MQTFGGDPRSLFLTTIFSINKYFSITVILSFLCLIPNRATDLSFLLVYIFFSVVEIIRLLLFNMYLSGSVQFSIIFAVLTLVPILIIDFLWLFYIESRTAFDLIVMIAMTIIHVLEFFYSFIAIAWMNKYTTRFYRFRYGKSPDNFGVDEDSGARD